MFLILFLLFTAMPAAEIYLLIKVGHVLGAWNTVGLLLLSGFIGAWCVKAQTQGILMKLNQAIGRGELPPDELVNAVCVFVGGILMIAPGFITDVMGILLVLPPTRFIFVKFAKIYLASLVKKGVARVQFFRSEGMNSRSFHTTWTSNYSAHQSHNNESVREVFDVSQNVLEEPEQKSFKDVNPH